MMTAKQALNNLVECCASDNKEEIAEWYNIIFEELDRIDMLLERDTRLSDLRIAAMMEYKGENER